MWKHYHRPATVDEAAALLDQYGGQARVIAGGTDLLVDMRAGHAAHQEALVDITSIPELCEIEESDGVVTIGAGVTHTAIVKTSLLAQRATCLVESCGVVGGPQVRNVATLGGNVAHALPAGDGTTSLVALDAEVEIVQAGERRWVPILEMFLGPGKSLLNPSRDVLLKMRFKLTADREATAFSRIMRPQGVALPILGCAVWVRLDESGSVFEDSRISIAPAGPTPRRVAEVEDWLRGKPVGEATIHEAAAVGQRVLSPRTSKYRATADYRHEMIAVLLKRTLPRAADRARTGEAVPEGIGI